jgi:hypothetical protein
MMKFKNPTNDFIEESSVCGLWCFLFGPLYFMYKGVWSHAAVSLILALCTMGLSNLVYPFFAGSAVRNNYLSKGWKEVHPNTMSTA